MRALNRFSTFQMVLLVLAVSLLAFTAAFLMAKNTSTVSGISCEGTCVALKSGGANPNSIAVAKGSSVQFNSADGKTHSLSLGEGGEEHSHSGKFSSGDFKADEAWRVQFNDEGSFYFHDHYNPQINILVVVYTPGKEYKLE